MNRAFDSMSAPAACLRAPESPESSRSPARDAFRHARLVGVRDRLGARLVADRSGAALAEFALAIMPVLCLFFGMMQWTLCAYANLIVQHAAYVAARAEAVMLPGMPDNGSASGTTTDLTAAITPLFLHVPGALGLSSTGLGLLRTSITTKPKNNCDQTVDTVQAQLYYRCQIPLGNAIACPALFGGIGGIYMVNLKATASFPNQGSYYQKVWNSQIGGDHSNCQDTGS